MAKPAKKRPHFDSYKDIQKRLKYKAQKYDLPCHICGEKFDWDLEYHDRMAFTMDHLEPLSRGGRARGEGKPAHRSCNSRVNNQPRGTSTKSTSHSRKW